MKADPELDDLVWLLGPEAAVLLDQLGASSGQRGPAAPGLTGRQGRQQVRAADRLPAARSRPLQVCGKASTDTESAGKDGLSRARVHLVVEQVELRRKGAAKFPHAECMFFLAQALQQATDLQVARYKASRFPPGIPVADLCCGIGGDSMALAERGPITALDRDPAAVLFARANLRAAAAAEQHAPHEFRVEDVSRFCVVPYAAWHLDPDRRAEGRRSTHLAGYCPGMETIDRLLGERGEGAIKLAPATEVPEDWQDRAELEWISRDRQCRQQVAWFGGLARSPGLRRATVLRSRPGAPASIATFAGDPQIRPSVAQEIGPYVVEPDAAVLAAGLAGAIAEHHGLAALHPAVPYFTANERIDDPLMQCFEVCDVLPFDRKRLRKLLGERGVGRLEIKTRGVEESPEAIRRDLRLSGEGEATLLIARLGRRVKAIVARRG